MRNARVFISCGQKTEKEVTIGKSVEKYFKRKGFETYFAEEVHSSDALTENIFKFLEQSEYFVFIDFKREEIKKDEYRGSLFVNQEVAIATFLRLKGLGFCEKGVKREGILSYHLYNEFSFKDITEIISILDEKTRTWNIESVNELKMIYDPNSTSKNVIITNHPQQPLSDWYHLKITNRNKSKHAFSCFSYITKIKNLNSNKEYSIPTNELIWSGISSIEVNIIGGTSRALDAFYVVHEKNQIHLHQRPTGTTNQRYNLPSLPQGKYLIEYTIISSNFKKISHNYRLEFESSISDIIFEEEL